MSRRWLPAPRPASETGEVAGRRPYSLWLPDSPPPWPAMLILHGAGSRKENHADFARLCAASGWAALAYDQRGHGRSSDEMSPGAVGDVARIAAWLAERAEIDRRRICVRGSSMGGWMAIHGAAGSPLIAGVIAICPAGEEHLLRGLRNETLEFRASPRSRAELAAWLAEHDVREAVERLAGRPLILLHAQADERIPVEFSAELHERATEPRRLVTPAGGHHRSIQHDEELQAEALRWLSRKLAGDAQPPGA